METKIDYLGKVSFTIEGEHNINIDYDKLVLVFDKTTYTTYVSRRPVPAGTLISDKKYWMRFSSLAERIIIDYNNWVNTYGAKIKVLEQGKLDKTGAVIDAPVRFVFTQDKKSTEIINGNIYLTDGTNKLYLTPNDLSLYKDGKLYSLTDKIGQKEFIAEVNARKAIKLVNVTPTEANVKEEFVLRGLNNIDLGPHIKVYKDSSIEDVFSGHVDDRLTNADETGVSADTQITSGTGDYALCIIYFLNNGKYKLTAVPIGDFLNEALFKDGLKVVNNKVYVNISAENPTSNFLGINENKEIYLKGIQEMYNDILVLKEEIKKFNKVVYLGQRVDEVISNIYENIPGLVSFVYDRVKDRKEGNGMGYVLLNKDVPFEDQVVLSNTIYEIRYDFNLFDKEITIPNNCVLRFDGGSLSNGTIIGNNTSFVIYDKSYVFKDVIFSGTYFLDEINTVNYFYTDLKQLFTNISVLSNSVIYTTIYLENKEYNFSSTDIPIIISLNSNTIIEGNNAKFNLTTSNNPRAYNLFLISNKENITIKNIYIVGDASMNTADAEWGHGISIRESKNIIIENCNIQYCKGDGINISVTTNEGELFNRDVIIKNSIFKHNSRCGIGCISVDGLLIENCKFDTNGDVNGRMPKCSLDIEPNIDLQRANNININNCESYNDNGLYINSGRSNNARVVIDNWISNSDIGSFSGIKNTIIKNSVFNELVLNTESNQNLLLLNCILTGQEEYDLYKKNIKYENVTFYSSIQVSKIFEKNFPANSVTKLSIPKIMGRIKITVIPTEDSYNNTTRSVYYYIDSNYNTTKGLSIIEAGANLTSGGIRLFNNEQRASTIMQRRWISLSNIIVTESTLDIYITCPVKNRGIIKVNVENYSAIYGGSLRKPLIKDNIVLTNIALEDVPSDINYDETPINEVIFPADTNITTYTVADLTKYAYGKDIFAADYSEKYRVYNGFIKKYKEHYIINAESGASSNRPTRKALLEIGYTYFDTDLNKPIYWNGTAWVDSTGANV